MSGTEEIRELKNTVVIDDQEYNVNAKKAETASKVANKLTISVKRGETNTTTNFDGSAGVAIDIPTYTLTKNEADSTITLIGSDGTSSTINDSNSGDMRKLVYDTNDDGIVDKANQVVGTLTIQKDNATVITFDGSSDAVMNLDALSATENANKIKVTMANNSAPYATITIKPDDPSGGNIGDIWFKY